MAGRGGMTEGGVKRVVDMERLRPESLTWTVLLGRWVEFAKASVALPADDEGARWRGSVAAVINLQAVTFALGDLGRLGSEERALGRDKAEVLIRENAGVLEGVWRGEVMPGSLMELCGDAREALEMSAYAGVVELVWEGPGPMVMPRIEAGKAWGTLAVMQPGTIVMPGEPVAWWVDRDGTVLEGALAGCVKHEPRVPRQVYRQIDENGRITGDMIAALNAEPPAGMPLLVPLFERGRPVGHFTLEAERWEAQQRAAMEGEMIGLEGVEGAARPEPPQR